MPHSSHVRGLTLVRAVFIGSLVVTGTFFAGRALRDVVISRSDPGASDPAPSGSADEELPAVREVAAMLRLSPDQLVDSLSISGTVREALKNRDALVAVSREMQVARLRLEALLDEHTRIAQQAFDSDHSHSSKPEQSGYSEIWTSNQGYRYLWHSEFPELAHVRHSIQLIPNDLQESLLAYADR